MVTLILSPIPDIYLPPYRLSMGTTQVTQKLWTAVMGYNPSHFKGDNLPVENVSWYDAIEFCNRLSRIDGLKEAYTVRLENAVINSDFHDRCAGKNAEINMLSF